MPSFILQSSGQCANPLTTALQCEQAATHFGFADPNADVVTALVARPHGCTWLENHGHLIFNLAPFDELQQACSQLEQCLCLAPTGATAAPTAVPAGLTCGPGHYLGSEDNAFGQPQDVCKPCQLGHYQPASGATFCEACTLGKFAAMLGRSHCSPCPAGTEAHRMAQHSCDDCAAGKYGSTSGQRHCAHCAVGRYQPAEGSTACIECGANTRGDGAHAPSERASASHCVSCEAGRWRSLGTDSTLCAGCPAGQHRPSGVVQCRGCAAGRFSKYPGAAECTGCPAGRFHGEAGAIECSACNAGTHASTVGSAACADCEAGRSTIETGKAQCDGCAPGQFKYNLNLDQKPLCSLCEQGKHSGEGMDECVVCPPGHHATSPGTATPCSKAVCAEGQFSTPGGCKACPAGKHSASPPGLECPDCAAGFHQHVRGSTSCYESHCARGHFQDPAGYQNQPAPTKCLACPWGKHQPLPKQGACVACTADQVPAVEHLRSMGLPTDEIGAAFGVCSPRGHYHAAPIAAQPEQECSHLTCALERGHTCAHQKLWHESSLSVPVWSVGCNGKQSTHEHSADSLAREQSYTSIRVFHHGNEVNGVRHRCAAVPGDPAPVPPPSSNPWYVPPPPPVTCKCTCWSHATAAAQSPATALPTVALTTEAPWGGETVAQQAQDLG